MANEANPASGLSEELHSEANADELQALLADSNGDRAPELDKSLFAEVKKKPISELPEIGETSVEGQEFWCRRSLRPEGEGANYHNIPILRFGIDYKGDTAVLSLPAREYINDVVTKYNPGGFTFVESTKPGIETGDDFLAKIAQKQFPWSEDREVITTGIPDAWLNFRWNRSNGSRVYPRQVLLPPRFRDNISPYEHDRVDHLGIAVLPGTEADKLAEGAELIHTVDAIDPGNKPHRMAGLDRLLDSLSYYALLPAESTGDLEAEFKDFVWGLIAEYTSRAWYQACLSIMNYHHKVGTLQSDYIKEKHGSMAAFYTLDTEEKRQTVAEFDKLTKEKLHANHVRALKLVNDFTVDREAYDENIKRMQALKPAA